MLVSDEGTQTEYCKYLLSAKIETMLLKNEVAKMKTQLNPSTKIVSSLSYEAISQDSSPCGRIMVHDHGRPQNDHELTMV